MVIPETVAVVIGTYGVAADWIPLMQRAAESVTNQTHAADCVIWEHADTLQHARNYGAARAEHCEWLIFLDADDELEPGYIEAMLAGVGDLRRPSTRGVYEDGSIEDPPSLIPERPLKDANYIVIGAMCRSELFFKVDGFAEWPILEDWDLWQRIVLAGGVVETVPAAVYRIHVRSDSRNTKPEHGNVYGQIKAQYATAWMGWRP